MFRNIVISLLGLIIAFIIGLGFIFLLRKTQPIPKLNKFIILIGASVIGFIVFAILHNIISGVLSQLLNKSIEEPVFFILSTIVCPIAFVVGIIGSVIQLIKK